MKTGITRAALALAGILGVTSVTAAPVTITDYVEVNEWLSTWEKVSWEHEFEFTPPFDVIYDATLTIAFEDDDVRDRWYELEFALGGIAGAWDIAFGEVGSGSEAFGIDVAEVEDGVLGVWIKSLAGDFKVLNSTLDISYRPLETPVSVPEPATVALLGLGLLGLGLTRQRLRKSAT